MIRQLFDPVFGCTFQSNTVDLDLRAIRRERMRRQFFHTGDVPLHARDGTFEFGLQILIPADRTAELIFQRLQLPQTGFHFHLADQFRIAGNLCGKRGEVNRGVVDLVHAATFAFQGIVDEFLFPGQNLIHPGIKRFGHAVPDDLNLREDIALTHQAAGSLFGVGRAERRIQIVFYGKTFLHVDSGAEPLCRAHDDADIAGVHHIEHLLPLFVGLIIIDDRDLIGGDAPFDQFPFDFAEHVEIDRLAVFELVKIAEHDLSGFDGMIGMIFFQNLIDADIQFGAGIVLCPGSDQTQVNRRLAGESVDQQRNVRELFLLRMIELFKPGVNIAQIIHELRNLLCSRQADLFRMPALDRRFRDARQIFRQNHVRAAPEHFGEFHDVRIFCETGDHFEAPCGVDLQRGFTLGEGRCEPVERVHMELFQRIRRNVADHIEQFRKLIGNRSAGCRIDVPAAGFCPDMVEFQRQRKGFLRSGVVQPLHPRHLRDEEVPLVAVNLVDEEAVHAQLIEIDDILGRMAILQLVEILLQTASALFLRLLLAAIELTDGVACGLNVLHLVQFRLIFRSNEIGIVLDHIEGTLGDDDDVPFPGGDPPQEAFALFLDQILPGCDQDTGRRIELRGEFRELLKSGVLYDDHRFSRQLETNQFHRGGDHDRGLAGPDGVRQQGILLNAPRDRPLLVSAQDERFGVDHRTRAGIDVERRKIVLLQNVVVEAFVVDLLDFPGQLPVVHDEIMKPVLNFVLVLPCRQRRFFVDDINKFPPFRIPDRFADDRIFQIQNEFNQFQSVEFVEVVLIEKLAALIIRTHFPAVGIGVIPDFDFSVQIPGDPLLNDFRRQPERAESEVDVFNGQRLRQNRFQRLHIGGQSPFAGFFNFHSDVPGKVTALEFNLI